MSHAFCRYCQRTLTDLTVFVDCTRFDVHKAVLACHSGYFANMFQLESCDSCASDCTMKLDSGLGITANTFRAILDFMYSGSKYLLYTLSLCAVIIVLVM